MVWADFSLFPQDYSRVKVGQKITISPSDNPGLSLDNKIAYISPFGDPHTQARLVRVELSNPNGDLFPGLFATAEVVVESASVPVAIKKKAIHTFRDWTVVFINVGDLFEARVVELGRGDSTWIEVLRGLRPGQRYATKNSFIIKADILKSGAAHSH